VGFRWDLGGGSIRDDSFLFCNCCADNRCSHLFVLTEGAGNEVFSPKYLFTCQDMLSEAIAFVGSRVLPQYGSAVGISLCHPQKCRLTQKITGATQMMNVPVVR